MSSKSGKRLTTKQRKLRKQKLSRRKKREYCHPDLDDSIFPPEMEEIHNAVVSHIRVYVANKSIKPGLLNLGPLQHTIVNSVIWWTIWVRKVPRALYEPRYCPYSFHEDVAHPEFFTKLDKFIDQCAEAVK